MATPINPENVDDWDEPLNADPLFTSSHVFSTTDITVTFDGDTIGTIDDPSSVFDTSGGNGTKETKDGVTLYPIDSEFGFYVEDFENATGKLLDGDYAEGFAGDLMIDGEQVGLVVSDSPTDTFKTPALLGTWLAGLGGNSVKASTEHYMVMQNVLSDQHFPGDSEAEYPLDDNLFVIGGEFDGQSVTDAILALKALEADAGDRNGDGVIDIKDVLAPNETEIDTNIAVSTDYSVTLKDDGKLLYRWGNMIKKPNDIRMEATLDLPEEWSEFNTSTNLRNLFVVTDAELVVHHTITNNPNDQVRPEDFENEAAIGTLPTYEIIESYFDASEPDKGTREVWVSTDDYYAGDGTLYPAGTILKDAWLAEQWANSDLAAVGATDGGEGFTNAWYTTMDREPFEPVLNDDGTDYEDSGPRWRLKPGKYGQDLPGVEITVDPSSPPPAQKDDIKYEVGAETQTVLNLLDWGDPAAPLALSAGWQDKPGEVSENGVNYSDGFDISVYIKGDIKPARIFSAALIMDYMLLTPFAFGATVQGTEGDDYLVGIGDNVFNGGDTEGGDGRDIYVVSYGASLDGVALSESVINGFDVGEDALGFIGLGVTEANFEDWVTQEVVEGNLEVSIDRDGDGGEDAVVVATLTGVDEELDLEPDILLANPGEPTGPGGEEPTVITGTDASETIIGTLGDDIISGLGGSDIIYGLTGEDQISGGAGVDRLTGGEDADVFVFEVGTRLDIVTDFQDDLDLIELVGVQSDDFATAVTISAYQTDSTLITVGTDRMILRDVDQGLIDADDFIFEDALLIA